MDTAQIAPASLLVWSFQCSQRGMPGTRSPPPFDRGTSEIVDSGVPTPGPDQNKRTFEISPTTPVGPVKEPMCNTGNSLTLREVTANDRNGQFHVKSSRARHPYVTDFAEIWTIN